MRKRREIEVAIRLDIKNLIRQGHTPKRIYLYTPLYDIYFKGVTSMHSLPVIRDGYVSGDYQIEY